MIKTKIPKLRTSAIIFKPVTSGRKKNWNRRKIKKIKKSYQHFYHFTIGWFRKFKLGLFLKLELFWRKKLAIISKSYPSNFKLEHHELSQKALIFCSNLEKNALILSYFQFCSLLANFFGSLRSLAIVHFLTLTSQPPSKNKWVHQMERDQQNHAENCCKWWSGENQNNFWKLEHFLN